MPRYCAAADPVAAVPPQGVDDRLDLGGLDPGQVPARDRAAVARQVLVADLTHRALPHGMRQRLAQLGHVARPRVPGDGAQGLGREPDAPARGDLGQEPVDDRTQVAGPLAQRRDGHGDLEVPEQGVEGQVGVEAGVRERRDERHRRRGRAQDAEHLVEALHALGAGLVDVPDDAQRPLARPARAWRRDRCRRRPPPAGPRPRRRSALPGDRRGTARRPARTSRSRSRRSRSSAPTGRARRAARRRPRSHAGDEPEAIDACGRRRPPASTRVRGPATDAHGSTSSANRAPARGALGLRGLLRHDLGDDDHSGGARPRTRSGSR